MMKSKLVSRGEKHANKAVKAHMSDKKRANKTEKTSKRKQKK